MAGALALDPARRARLRRILTDLAFVVALVAAMAAGARALRHLSPPALDPLPTTTDRPTLASPGQEP